jgi:protein-tyrosine phosphatase
VRERTLTWDGCLNVRDLGGHPTEDGSVTRFREVVRADSVRALSNGGWSSLLDYGIATIVDLRLHEELEADPPRELPVDVVHVSLFGSPDAAYWQRVDALAAAQPDEVASTREVYLRLLADKQRNVAAAICAVARAREGGVLVHCAAGKDRTGLVTALLLRLARVGLDEIGEDYARCGEALAASFSEWIAEGEDERERERRRRQCATPAAAMRGFVTSLEARFGSVDEFLREGGATTDDLAAARARLRD